MPSAIGHAIFAASLSPFRPYQNKLLPTLLLGMFCASMPDLDVIGFSLGIPYHSMLGHRGFSHSILFSILTGIIVCYTCFQDEFQNSSQRFQISFYYFLITMSHGVLDALTDGGLGVGFFIPFYNERFFFPVRPIPVSSLNIQVFFSEIGYAILKEEMKFIGFISTLTLLCGYYWRKRLFNGVL